MGNAPRSASTPRRRALGGLLAAGGALAAAALAAACRGEGGGRSESRPAATGAGGEAAGAMRPGGVLRQWLPADPPGFDLSRATSHLSVWAAAPCFNQLLRFDPERPQDRPSDILGDLALRWEQPDPLTLSFTLRSGVRFHNGGDLSAEDVRVRLERLRTEPAAAMAGVAAAMAAVETPDSASVRVRLSRPAPSLLVALAGPAAGVGRARDGAAGDEAGALLNGTGPFRLKSYQRANLLELERNPAYHEAGRPLLDGLRFYILPDRRSAFEGFARGAYDLLSDPGLRAAERAALREGGRGAAVVDVPSTLREVVLCNGRRAPFGDLRVRRAIGLALDRDAAIARAGEGAARRGGYMLPGGAWALPQAELRKIEGYGEPDAERARALLRAAGVETPLAVSCTTPPEARELGEFVRDGLARIGLAVKLVLADAAAARAAVERGDFELAAWPVATAVDDPDAAFSASASGAALGWSGVTDERLAELYERQSRTMDYGERRRLVAELEAQALALHEAAVLCFLSLTTALDGRVRDFTPHSSPYTNRRLEEVWLAA